MTQTARHGYPEWDRLASELVASLRSQAGRTDDGLRLALYTTEVGSASRQALDLLASWTATPDSRDLRRDARKF